MTGRHRTLSGVSMRSLCIVAASAILILSCFGGACLQAATITEVMNQIQSIRRAIDFRAEGRLVLLDGAGQRMTYRLSLKAKFFPEGLKVLCEVTDPPAARLRLLIEAPEKGNGTMRLAKAQDERVEQIHSEHWGEPILDTGLAFEDLVDAHFFWRLQTLVGEEKHDGRDCYVINSRPDSGDESHYSAVTSWIDKRIYFPILVQKREKGTGSIKEFTYQGLQQSKGVWGARQMEVRIKGNPRRTLLVIAKGSGKAKLNASDFDARLLVNPEQKKGMDFAN
jgi:hypothetical protein